MIRFEYVRPASLAEALNVLKEAGPRAKVVAGGTDLLVQMKERRVEPRVVVSINRLQELRGIQELDSQGLRIGSRTRMRELEISREVRQRFQALAEGAHVVGSIQTRHMATIGGNLCNAAPSADTAPPVLALGGACVIAGPGGAREVPSEDFFVGPGQTVLGPGELLLEIRIPNPASRTGSAYFRHTPRKWMDIALVGVGASLTLEEDMRTCSAARVVLGAVAPVPMRAVETERRLIGAAVTPELISEVARIAAGESRPISDVRGSADYRRAMVEVWTRRALATAFDRCRDGRA